MSTELLLQETIEAIDSIVEPLTIQQREQLFNFFKSKYCIHCGCIDPSCHCWDDSGNC